MAIINSTVTQGAEIKQTDASTTVYVADQVVFTVGGISLTQRQLITGGICFLAAWALKD